ncbi:MAG: hypothetical protein JXA60_05865 [Candidatus Coatesbacteria bacterium]|nr:hypothetical protein [Candidatus Coatesbacteria bacterium]
MRSTIIILGVIFIFILSFSVSLLSEDASDEFGHSKTAKDEMNFFPNSEEDYPAELKEGIKKECIKISDEVKKLALDNLEDSEDIRYVLIKFYLNDTGKPEEIIIQSYVDQKFLEKVKKLVETYEFKSFPQKGRIAIQFKVGI